MLAFSCESSRRVCIGRNLAGLGTVPRLSELFGQPNHAYQAACARTPCIAAARYDKAANRPPAVKVTITKHTNQAVERPIKRQFDALQKLKPQKKPIGDDYLFHTARNYEAPNFHLEERVKPKEQEFLETYSSKLTADHSVYKEITAAAAGQPSTIQQARPAAQELAEVIQRATTVVTLGDILDAHLEHMENFHVTASIVQLARLADSDQAAWASRSSSSTSSRQPALLQNARQVGQQQGKGGVGWKAAASIETLMPRLLRRVREASAVLDAQGVANVLWAMARLRYKDPAAVSELLQVALVRVPELHAQHASNILYALASMRDLYRADSRVLTALVASCQSKLYLFKPQAFSNTAWALATLGCRPSSEWLDRFFQCSSPRLQSFQPQHLATVMWALCRFKTQPTGYWFERFVKQSGRCLLHFSWRDLSNTVWALANLHLNPGPEWMVTFCRYTGSCMAVGNVDASGLCGCIYALARLRHRPDDAWSQLFFQATASLMRQLSPLQLADVIKAVAALRLVPEPSWMDGFLERLAACAVGLPLKHLVGVRDALKTLGYSQHAVFIQLYGDGTLDPV